MKLRNQFIFCSLKILTMAISKNPLLKHLRGTIGKQIVVREFFGKQIISAYPEKSKVPRSKKQVRQNNRMALANIEVQEILADEQKRNEAQIRLNVQRNRLRSALISEVMLRMIKEDAKNVIGNE